MITLRRLLYIVPIVLLGLFTVLAWRGLAPGRDPSALPSALIGKPVPQFSLPPLDAGGAPLTTQDLVGRVTVLNFFASWCLPCKVEHMLLFQLGREFQAPVYGIAFKDKPVDIVAFVKEMGSPYRRIGVDESGRTSIDFGITGVPETFILDKAGIVRYRLAKPIDPDRLAGEIAPLIKGLQR